MPPWNRVSFATPAIAGQNFGARNAERVRETFRKAALIGSAFMFGLTLFCQWRPEWLVAAFSSDPQVLDVAATFMRLVSWNFVAAGLTFTCSGMFQGMGNTVPSLMSKASRLVTFVGPAFWLASQPGFRIEHVWYLSIATVLLEAAFALFLLHREFRRRLQFV